jgi:S-DNA-T family DNA segregation ATPase FtsK/SpoIIIE
MTDRSDTLNPGPTALTTLRSRYAGELLLFLGLVLLVYWGLALGTHSLNDPAWSTSGNGAGIVRNQGGLLGAWVADVSYYLFGFSVWWCWAAAVRGWFSALARALRAPRLAVDPADQALDAAVPVSTGWAYHAERFVSGRWGFWTGLALLMLASSALEWARFYSYEPLLPGHAGGVLGYWIGPLAARWFGPTGWRADAAGSPAPAP